MPVLVSNQAYVFVWTVVGGILIGMVYDLFRVFRKFTKAGVITIFFEDLIFWIIVSLILFIVLYISNDGGIRPYVFVGAALGAVFYFLTISPIFMKIVIGSVKSLKWLLKTIIKILIVPVVVLNNMLKRPAKRLCKIGKVVLRSIRRFIKYVIRYVETTKKVFRKISRKI